MRLYRDSFVRRKSERSFKGQMSPSSKIWKHVFQIFQMSDKNLTQFKCVCGPPVTPPLKARLLQWVFFIVSNSHLSLLSLWDFSFIFMTSNWSLEGFLGVTICRSVLFKSALMQERRTDRTLVCFWPDRDEDLPQAVSFFLQTALIIWNYFLRWINRHAVRCVLMSWIILPVCKQQRVSVAQSLAVLGRSAGNNLQIKISLTRWNDSTHTWSKRAQAARWFYGAGIIKWGQLNMFHVSTLTGKTLILQNRENNCEPLLYLTFVGATNTSFFSL